MLYNNKVQPNKIFCACLYFDASSLVVISLFVHVLVRTMLLRVVFLNSNW